MRSYLLVLRLTLDEEQWLLVLRHDEVHFPSFGILEESQLEITALSVFEKVTPLQKMPRDHVLKSGTYFFHEGPIEMIVLLFFFDRFDARRAESRYSVERVKSFEDIDPSLDRLVTDLDIPTYRID